MTSYHKLNPINIFWNAKFGINLYLHVLILLSFLTIFFIMYISKLTTSAFEEEVSSLIKDNLGEPLQTIVDWKENNYPLEFNEEQDTIFVDIKNNADNIITKLQTIYKQPYGLTEAKNEGLFNLIKTINVILWIFFVFILLVVNNCANLSIKNLSLLILENLVVFTFIGSIEYIFFTQIAFKYVPVVPSFISQQFVSIIKDKFTTE